MKVKKPDLERTIHKSTVDFARGKGVASIRMYFGPGMQTGWPDHLFLIPGGRPLFIEFKSRGKKPTMIQRKKIRTLKKAGYNVKVCDCRADGKIAILNALAAAGELQE